MNQTILALGQVPEWPQPDIGSRCQFLERFSQPARRRLPPIEEAIEREKGVAA